MNNAVPFWEGSPTPPIIHYGTHGRLHIFLTQSLNTLLSLNHYKLRIFLSKYFSPHDLSLKANALSSCKSSSFKLNFLHPSHAWKVYSMTYCGLMVRAQILSMHDILKQKSSCVNSVSLWTKWWLGLSTHQSSQLLEIFPSCTSVGWLNHSLLRVVNLVHILGGPISVYIVTDMMYSLDDFAIILLSRDLFFSICCSITTFLHKILLPILNPEALLSLSWIPFST